MWCMKPLFLKPVMAIFGNSHVRTFSSEMKHCWTAPSLDFWKERAPHSTSRAGRKNLAKDSPIPLPYVIWKNSVSCSTLVAARDVRSFSLRQNIFETCFGTACTKARTLHSQALHGTTTFTAINTAAMPFKEHGPRLHPRFSPCSLVCAIFLAVGHRNVMLDVSTVFLQLNCKTKLLR